MFTLTFYKHGCMDKVVVCGEKYSVDDDHGRVSVSVFKDMNIHGSHFLLVPERQTVKPVNSFRACFVTADNGRTVDRVEPYMEAEEVNPEEQVTSKRASP